MYGFTTLHIYTVVDLCTFTRTIECVECAIQTVECFSFTHARLEVVVLERAALLQPAPLRWVLVRFEETVLRGWRGGGRGRGEGGRGRGGGGGGVNSDQHTPVLSSAKLQRCGNQSEKLVTACS